MFFNPTISSTITPITGEPSDCYSDCHKDAFGCRPRKPEPTEPHERAIEWDAINQWFKEGERIDAMRTEVARFDFSRGIEYRRRREGLSHLEAFERTLLEHINGNHHGSNGYSLEELTRDWDYTCFLLGLPYSDAPKLKQWWEGLKG